MLYMNKTSAAIDTSLELKDIKIEYSKGKKEKIILIVSLSIALFIARRLRQLLWGLRL